METLKKSQSEGKKSEIFKILLALSSCAFLAVVITYILYGYTQNLLKDRLQERITSVASTAATAISANDIAQVYEPDDLVSDEAKNLAARLSSIRNANNDIRYIYLLRRTKNTEELAFVIDSESLDSKEVQEKRAGKELGDEDLAPLPGDILMIAEYPALRDEAFYHPVAEKELQKDQWSTQMSAYAPIFDKTGNVIAVLGIDVEVQNYLSQIQTTLLPFLLFIFFLVVLLSLLSVLLIRFSGEKVKILEEIDRQKDELLGIVSHQLAKPITAIKWNLELLLDGDVGQIPKEGKEMMESMQKVTHHLAELVNMILDVSKIQLGKMNLEAQPLDLKEFFSEIIEVIEPGAKERKINFKKNLPIDLPTVLLDKRYMRMTVENLLSNAIKYTPVNGDVELKVEITQSKMYCHVRDSGCGIPLADQKKIFGKLYRATNVRNTVDGNGFGLYVAKGAIEGQGGRMWFESTEGKGTTFFFELPLKMPKV
jgi:signal transduction histidine kinase